MSAAATEGLPEADTPGEVLGSIHYVLNSLGRELGERYDTHLKAVIGPNWAPALANIRHVKHINKYDPHFVLAEPLKFPDSPTRACLPSGGAFFNKLEDALDVRNAWSHHEVDPINLVNLKAGISTLHVFADAAGLKLGKLCSDIRKRINAIVNGTYPPAGSAQTTDSRVDIDGLLAELAEARANEQALRADVAAAQSLLDDAAAAGAEKADMAAQLSAIRQRLEQALADKQKLEFVIEALATAEASTPVAEDSPVPAVPGHVWPGVVPTRSVTMMSLHPDLFDPATGQRISAEFGVDAQRVVATWKATVAPNATVLLTPLGQAVTYINGVPIYLGSLGGSDRPAADEQLVAGFFIPHSYTLRMNGTVEDRDSGDTLADVNPDAAARTSARLLDLIPTGGRLRVTTAGGLARYSDGEWTVVTTITPEDWFPGHLP